MLPSATTIFNDFDDFSAFDTWLPAFVRDLVAITLSTGGATADVPRRLLLRPDDRWYFPRFPELTRIVPLTGLEAAFGSFLSDHLPAFDACVIR